MREMVLKVYTVLRLTRSKCLISENNIATLKKPGWVVDFHQSISLLFFKSKQNRIRSRLVVNDRAASRHAGLADIFEK